MISHYIRLLRPRQWVKNSFIFLPIFFNGSLFDPDKFTACLIAFFAFGFAASAIYCLNDIRDAAVDRLHPVKCKRPIAARNVSTTGGYIAMIACLLAVGGIISFFGGGNCAKTELFTILAIYIAINTAYCLGLKQIALIDVFIISLNFVLRLLAGSAVTGIMLTHWLVLMTFLLALFLAFAKRRDELLIYEETGVKSRSNINRYNSNFLNLAIAIIVAVTMVCYCMYTVSETVMSRFGTSYLYITALFVLLGMLRYLQLTVVDVRSGNPTKILYTDRFLQCCVLGWITAFVIIIYC